MTRLGRYLAPIAALSLLMLSASGCGNDAGVTSENYGDLLASPEGLVLVRSEHPTGWGRPDCFSCHEIRNIHTVNRTSLPDLDLEEVRTIVLNQGAASCGLCHGNNGVAP